jgi:hypothetical protein
VLRARRNQTPGDTRYAVQTGLSSDPERAFINSHSGVEGGHESVGDTVPRPDDTRPGQTPRWHDYPRWRAGP